MAVADGDVALALRGAVTLLGAGERSGEAGFARLRAAVRGAATGAIVVARAASPPSLADAAGPSLAAISIYLLMVVVLFWKPQGLFPARG